MDQPSLAGCDAKFDRAREHLQSLYNELNAWSHSDSHELVREHDPETRTDQLFVKVLRKPDKMRWGILLGDFLHNARCVLDHLVWQLVLLNGQKPGRDNQFPIASSGGAYWAPPKAGGICMRDRMLKGVSEEHRTMIDAMEPYRRGHDARHHRLAVLSSFSNADKHRLVQLALIALLEPNLDRDFDAWTNADSDGFVDVTFRHHGPLEDGTHLMTVKYVTDDPQARVQMKVNLPVGIGFGKEGLKAEVLSDVLGEVKGVLDAFRPSFE